MTSEEELTLSEALNRLGNYIATTGRDWAIYHADAWIWGLFCGWDCEDGDEPSGHVHDDDCGAAMIEVADLQGWSQDTVERLRRYQATIRAVQQLTDGTPAVLRRTPTLGDTPLTTPHSEPWERAARLTTPPTTPPADVSPSADRVDPPLDRERTPSQAPKIVDDIDHELAAMRTISVVLNKLAPYQRGRVLSWASALIYNMNWTTTPAQDEQPTACSVAATASPDGALILSVVATNPVPGAWNEDAWNWCRIVSEEGATPIRVATEARPSLSVEDARALAIDLLSAAHHHEQQGHQA